MDNNVLEFINKLESWKTAIKNLHWAANSLSQHQLCDDIASSIAEFQDTVSEVEQGIHGTIKNNQLKPSHYNIGSLKTFVQDIIKDTTSFYKGLEGDAYIGMRSDCESFLSEMQKFLYLVDFTLKEDLRRRLSVIKEAKKTKYVVIERKNGSAKMTVQQFKNLLKEEVSNILLRESEEHTLEQVKVYEQEEWYEWIAKCDRGWVEMRGTFNGYDVELDEVVIGNGGHGHFANEMESAEYWNQFKDEILVRVQDKIERGFVNG